MKFKTLSFFITKANILILILITLCIAVANLYFQLKILQLDEKNNNFDLNCWSNILALFMLSTYPPVSIPLSTQKPTLFKT